MEKRITSFSETKFFNSIRYKKNQKGNNIFPKRQFFHWNFFFIYFLIYKIS